MTDLDWLMEHLPDLNGGEAKVLLAAMVGRVNLENVGGDQLIVRDLGRLAARTGLAPGTVAHRLRQLEHRRLLAKSRKAPGSIIYRLCLERRRNGDRHNGTD
ncbi:MAG: hypothetical protein F4Y41_08540 [Gammaproteobacteria bacterium]|nr:hypothetical protein [Gammaproteobacteria bacterium]MYI05741.1 hypothetical protein [Gemmatimonadota bacterium]